MSPSPLSLAAAVAAFMLALRLAAAEVQESTLTAADGQVIVYDQRGAGEPALVFIHCWSCNRSFWKEQVEVFAQDHTVVTMDLPGHGTSEGDRQHWTLEAYADDVARVVDALDLKSVVLIGHSMGGPVALLAARKMPRTTQAVICVDTLQDADFKVPEEQLEQWLAAFRQDFEGQVRGFMAGMVLDNDPLKDWIVRESLQADQEALIQLMQEIGEFDQASAMQAAAVPIRCINAVPHGEMALPTNVEANRKYADFDVVEMEGVGHFVQLEDPQSFNAHLRALLKEVGQR
jgi:pimeloyl-ACP methyl ester carboxylesterase